MNQFSASLWGDEAWAATLAVKPILEIIQIVARDTSPPLYYLLLHIWMQIFGTSEISIRSLSSLFFLGTTLTAYFIGKHLWDKKTGVFTALLTFLNPFLFQYGFEGRMYSLLALTSTLSIYFFIKKQRVAFILATLAALYTHHFALFIVAFEGIWTLGKSWQKSKREILKDLSDFFFVALGYLPWLYPLYYQTSLVGSGFWLGKPSFSDLRELISKFLVGPEKGFLQKLALGAIFAILLFRMWKKDFNKTCFLLGWFFAPLLFTFFISQFFQSIFFDRYMLMSIPAVSLLIASLSRKVSLIPLFILLSSLAFLNYQYFLNPVKRPFRELANYVKKEKREGDFLINYNTAAHHLFESKYYGVFAPIYSPGGPLPFYTGTALMVPGDVIERLPANIQGRVGVIGSGDFQVVNLPGYNLLESERFGDLFFLWFTPEKSTV